MASSPSADLDQSLLSFEKLDRASPDLWPEQIPGVSDFAADLFKSPLSQTPPKWMAELEKDDIDMLEEFGSLTTSLLMEKVRGLQNLAYQLGLDEDVMICLQSKGTEATLRYFSSLTQSSGTEAEAHEMTRGKFLNILTKSTRR